MRRSDQGFCVKAWIKKKGDKRIVIKIECGDKNSVYLRKNDKYEILFYLSDIGKIKPSVEKYKRGGYTNEQKGKQMDCTYAGFSDCISVKRTEGFCSADRIAAGGFRQ